MPMGLWRIAASTGNANALVAVSNLKGQHCVLSADVWVWMLTPSNDATEDRSDD